MTKILIIYSTTDGHTREICLRLKKVIENESNQVTLLPIENENMINLSSFDKIAVGASIRYGKHHPDVYKIINENSQILDAKANAFFSVNLVARKPGRNKPETNPYLKKFISRITWKPRELAVFAGKIDYQKYKFWNRFMIRMIMWMTKGPTGPKAIIEFTDWGQVEEFGRIINKM